MLFVEWQHSIVKYVGNDQSTLTVIEFCEADLGVSIDTGLLIDMSYVLDVADVIGVLSAEIARVVSLDLAVGYLILFCLFESVNLHVGQNDTVFLDFDREGFQSLPERGQIVAQPDATHTAVRDNNASLTQFVGSPKLTEGGVLDGYLDNSLLDVFFYTALDNRLAARYLL